MTWSLVSCFQIPSSSVGRLFGGEVLPRGEPDRVDRADAGADEVVGPLAAALELGQDHRQRAGLVCPARAAPREDQPYARRRIDRHARIL